MPQAKPDPAYELWTRYPTPQNLKGVVSSYESTLQGAMRAMRLPQNPLIASRARIVMAQAIQRYNPASGVPLKNWIQQELQQLHRMSRQITEVVRVPERVRRESALLARHQDELKHELGRDPTPEEMADRTGVSTKRQEKLQRMNTMQMQEGALEEMSLDDESGMADAGVVHQDPHKEWQDFVYHDLDDTDKLIFRHRIGYRGYPVLENREISKRVGLSPAAVTKRAKRIETRLLDHG